MEDPAAFLGQFPDGAIIDEVQRAPDLLSRIQCVIDEDRVPGRWILVGSQNLYLLKSISQSLAGRTAVHNLLPLTRSEIMRFGNHSRNLEQVLISGAYPEVFALKMDPKDWFQLIRNRLRRTRREDDHKRGRSLNLSQIPQTCARAARLSCSITRRLRKTAAYRSRARKPGSAYWKRAL